MEAQAVLNRHGRGCGAGQSELNKRHQLLQRGALKSYSAIVQFLLKLNVRDDIIGKLDADVGNLIQKLISPP